MRRPWGKMRLLSLGALIFLVAMIGYWIGASSNRPHPGVIDMNAVQDPHKNDHDFHVLKDGAAVRRLGGKLVEDQQIHDTDHVYVVGNKGHRPNQPRNEPSAENMKDHAAGIHQGHANKISQSINKDETKVTPRQGLIVKHIKQLASTTTEVPYPKLDQGQSYYSLRHGLHSTKVHRSIHQNLKSMPDHVDPKNYIFISDKMPKEADFLPSVANGNLGTRVHSETVFMNGIYNGYMNSSHRAAIPSTCSFNITGTEPPIKLSRKYKLNVGEGLYEEEIKSKEFVVYHRIYAHRNYTNLIVVEVDLIRNYSRPLKLQVKLNKWMPSYDFTFHKDDSGVDEEVGYKYGTINSPETDKSGYQSVYLFYDHVPDKLEPQQNTTRTKWVFLTAIGKTKKEALDAYKLGAVKIKNHDQLYADHVKSWSELWQRGRIDVEGNRTIARAVYGSLYYILSSIPLREKPNDMFVGLSPGGLPFGGDLSDLERDYQGHVFWDQETWIYPTILMLYPDLAKILLNTRARTFNAAKENAKKSGLSGVRYPWESAYTGVEVSPSFNCSNYEIHINGDISFAIMQYLYATNYTHIIDQDTFGKILVELANFWVSKTIYNETKGKYEIHGVMPPDEYARHVNNSAYTNIIAQMALQAPQIAYKLLNISQTRWQRFAKNMYIPFNNDEQYHPEYEGYEKGTQIKQADVVLLGYPLMRDLSKVVRANDLKMYEKVTDPTGPAMTWSMHSIGWLELKDLTKAARDFNKNFDYIQQPFQVWTEETVSKGCRNFITGMGGFLQSVFYGYGGFRLRQTYLDFNPVLPPGVTSLDFIGVNYLDSSIDFFTHTDSVTITLTSHKKGAPPLHVIVHDKEDIFDLKVGTSLHIDRRTKMSVYNEYLPIPESPNSDF